MAADNVNPAVPGYEVLTELGRGGMGVVYLARQTRLNRLVALKMLLEGHDVGEVDLERFRREARALARLQHPAIVRVYAVSEHDGLPFFSMEYCPGGSLEKRLQAGPLLPREAAEVIRTLAQALQAAHQAGVIHRDLKPANILLSPPDAGAGAPAPAPAPLDASWALKVTDFGLARKLDEPGQTETGAVLGTPSYMAPEQAGGRNKEVGPAADVYALGALLYECLTGRPPFKAATVMETLLQVLGEEPVAPRQLLPGLPRDLETVCLKCLHKDPARRYPGAAELADDLGHYLDGKPVRARPVGLPGRTARWARRRPAVAALLVAVPLALLGGFGVSLHFWLQERGRALEARQAQDRTEEALAEAEEALVAGLLGQLAQNESPDDGEFRALGRLAERMART
jgi:serine/threonine protein kinase